MRAIWTKLTGDLRRHPVPGFVIAFITLLAVGVGTLALVLLSTSSAPFDRAFAQNRGAHLTITFSSRIVSQAQLAATAQTPHVVAVAGPWQQVDVPFAFGTTKTDLLILGRDDPNGPVTRLPVVAGRWVAAPGEIVLTQSFARLSQIHLGQQMQMLGRTDAPVLTVVGEVVDISEGDAQNWTPQTAWVVPGQIAALVPVGAVAEYVLAYRLDDGSAATLSAVSQRIGAELPPNAVLSIKQYTLIQQIDNLTTTLLLVFLLAFAVFALGAVALIVANVVAGAVLANIRDIGVIKALGFTPAQVVVAFVGQMLLPAFVGGLVGVPLGIAASIPILNQSADVLGIAPTTVLPVLEPVLALFGALAVVALAAGFPALRAARLSPLVALRRNDLPGVPHSRLGRLASAIGLGRSISLGIDDAYARPARGALTTIAVLIGVCTITFALGESVMVQRIAADPVVAEPDITIQRFGSYADATLMQTLQPQPQTKAIIAFTYASATVQGLTTPVLTVASRGNVAGYGYHLLAGRWYNAPGEVVGGGGFANEAHLHVGDTFSATINHHTQTLRLVGIYFDTNNFGRILRLNWNDLLTTQPTAQPTTYFVTLIPGADAKAYAQQVEASAPDFLSVAPRPTSSASVFGILDAVVLLLALVLGSVAVIGVFNTIFLTTRERGHDIAVMKALGMTPRQVMAMVLAAAGLLGLVGALVGIPAGVWLHHAILTLMGNAIGDPLPDAYWQNTFQFVMFPLLALVGVLAALVGALLPAWRAAHRPVVATLQSE